MQRLILISIIAFVFSGRSLAGNMDDFNKYFRLLPIPQKTELLNGEGIMFSGVRNIYLKNTDRRPVMPQMLLNVPFNSAVGDGTLILYLNKDIDLPSREGYILEISGKQLIIQAKNTAGLFYGLQTLNQLLEDSHDQLVKIPACRITDYPKIACRAVHIDLKSHLDAGYYYYRVIDKLASVKINTVIIEFEDKLRYRKAAAVGAPNSISVEEFAELSKYAKERNIEISPLVQGLGHASFILKHPEYKGLRDDMLSDYAFDPLNPKTYELQFSMYEDAMAATPFGKYLHIGGDEVGQIGKSALAKKSGMKPLQLQMLWLKKVTDFAIAHHRIPIFWDDMVFKLAGLYRTTYDSTMSDREVQEVWQKNEHVLNENISLFPRGCIYARWNYETPGVLGNKKAVDWYEAHQLNVMPVTSAQQSYVLLQRNHSNFLGIHDFCQIAIEKNIDKILCTVWDDSAPHFETEWRGLYDFALLTWNFTNNSEQEIHSIFRHRFFAPELQDNAYEFRDQVEDGVTFWETAFLDEGDDRENFRPDFKYITLPDGKPGSWSLKYGKKIEKAAAVAETYIQTKERITEALSLARRNWYTIEVLNQINEIQAYSANMLLLLNKYDKAPVEEKQNMLRQIKSYLQQFDGLRKNFEQVYSQIRMMKLPEGYVRDSNARRHWANATEGTDWIYFIELEMNKKIAAWINRVNL